MILPVILAGGTGSRLWPMSRKNQPKQLIGLHGELTMLQATISRLSGLICSAPIVICQEEHRFMVAEQLREMKVEKVHIILEPVGKNTAPATALAAFIALQTEKNPTLLILSADHVVEDEAAFRKAVAEGQALVEQGKIVTFGVTASYPETGYGYLKAREKGCVSELEAFVEKPSLADAEEYISSGKFYWNSGTFMFKAKHYLDELGQQRPKILESCKAATQGITSREGFLCIDKQIFELCPDESIDFAVMENAEKVWVIPLDAGWSDVGSWRSLRDIGIKDPDGNTLTGDVVTFRSRDCYLRSESRLVTVLGVDSLIVVETKDAVLVAGVEHAQDVKEIVRTLESRSRTEWEFHREVYRPWGKYDSVDEGPRYQVKKITVKPGEKLSVQMHHHRSEHWVVVAGVARVGKDDKVLLLTENESVYLPAGCVHWLENPGRIMLELIEVQCGAYLGEDDIVRLEDRYGRR